MRQSACNYSVPAMNMYISSKKRDAVQVSGLSRGVRIRSREGRLEVWCL